MASLDICVEGLLQLGGHTIFGVALEEVEGGRGGGATGQMFVENY